MKKEFRVTSNEDFGKCVKKGRTTKSPSYTVHFINNDLSKTRVGISVSSKVGNAVTRNRIKRQVRAMCDSLLEYNSSSNDIVLVVRQAYLDKEFAQNKEELKNTFTKLGLLK